MDLDAAAHGPAWVILDQVIELGLRGDVRFDPDSDHDRTALQYVAKGQRRKWPSYSISSSARPLNASETLMPNAFAVLRLIASSTLLTCWTGRSAGLSPLRIRPV